MRTRLTAVVAVLLGLAGALLPLAPAAAVFWFGALPPGPVSGAVTILVSASSNMDAGSLWVGDTRITSVIGPLSGRPVNVDTTKLADGPQTVAIKDAAGTTLLAPGGTLTVDNTAPQVDVSDAVTWNPLGLTFGYSVIDAHPSSAPAECSVVPIGDAPQWNPCLTDSTHDFPAPSSYRDFTFSVRATDAAGNVGTGSATVSYRAPEARLDQVPDLIGTGGLVALSPTVTDFSPGQTVRPSWDGNYVAVWHAPPFTFDIRPTGWGAGAHDLTVEIASPTPSVLVSVSKQVVVDVTPPTLTVAPASGDPLDSRFTSERPADWTVTATDLHLPVTTTCTVTDEAGHLWAAAACSGAFAPTALPQGALTLTVTATDAAGNQAEEQIPLVIDTAAPVLDVRTTPAAVSAAVPTVSFTSDNELAGRFVDYDCTLDGAALPCDAAHLDPDGDHVLTLSLPGMTDGPHELRLRAREVGNSSPWQQVAFTVDTHAPQVDAGAGLQTLTGPAVTLPYTATDVTAVSVSCSLRPAGELAVWQPCSGGRLTTTAAPGTYVFLVRATDAAGNTTFDQVVVTVVALSVVVPDRTAPTVRVTVRPKSTVRLHGRRTLTVRFRFGASEPAAYRCKVDAGRWRACSSSLTVKVRKGRHVVQLVATDAAGNASATVVVRWRVLR